MRASIRVAATLALLGSMLIPTIGAAKPSLEARVNKAHIVAQKGNSTPNTRAKFAHSGEKVILHPVVEGRNNGKKAYFSSAPFVHIKGRKIKTQKPLEGMHVQWYKVESDSNGIFYDNKADFNAPKVLRFTNTPWKKGWKVDADVHPTTLKDQFSSLKEGLGVMRYMAVVTYKGKRIATLGAQEIMDAQKVNQVKGRRVIDPKVMKVAYRPNTGSWTDKVFELFNTPYIWGSFPSDVNRQWGSDCADLVVYAARHSGRAKTPYTWSYGLRDHLDLVSKVDGKKGGLFTFNGKPIPWGKDGVQKGDALVGGRHAMLLYADNGDGYLGKNDLMVHTLFAEPTREKIGNHSVEDVRRFKNTAKKYKPDLRKAARRNKR